MELAAIRDRLCAQIERRGPEQMNSAEVKVLAEIRRRSQDALGQASLGLRASSIELVAGTGKAPELLDGEAVEVLRQFKEQFQAVLESLRAWLPPSDLLTLSLQFVFGAQRACFLLQTGPDAMEGIGCAQPHLLFKLLESSLRGNGFCLKRVADPGPIAQLLGADASSLLVVCGVRQAEAWRVLLVAMPAAQQGLFTLLSGLPQLEGLLRTLVNALQTEEGSAEVAYALCLNALLLLQARLGLTRLPLSGEEAPGEFGAELRAFSAFVEQRLTFAVHRKLLSSFPVCCVWLDEQFCVEDAYTDSRASQQFFMREGGSANGLQGLLRAELAEAARALLAAPAFALEHTRHALADGCRLSAFPATPFGCRRPPALALRLERLIAAAPQRRSSLCVQFPGENRGEGRVEAYLRTLQSQLQEHITLIESMSQLEPSAQQNISLSLLPSFEQTILSEFVRPQRLSRAVTLDARKSRRSSSLGPRQPSLPEASHFRKATRSFSATESVDWSALDGAEDVDFLGRDAQQLGEAAWAMMANCGVTERFSIERECFARFAARLAELYEQRGNPYHNFAHALTVMHGVYCLVQRTRAGELFDDVGLAALLFAALVHDVDHRGRANAFEVKRQSELALRYNDHSVLENHHLAVAFGLLQREELNIFKAMPRAEFLLLRELVIELVLMTDMNQHFAAFKRFKAESERRPFDEFRQGSDGELFVLAAGTLLHACDVYTPTRPLPQMQAWSGLLRQEFEGQLDDEVRLGLPVTPFLKDCRDPRQICLNELSFITNVVQPLYAALNDFLANSLAAQLRNLDASRAHWEAELRALGA